MSGFSRDWRASVDSAAEEPKGGGGRAGAPDSEEIVRLEGMTRRFGSLVAVDRLSLHVRRGEMFGLIGPDGAGKTTTLRVVLGLLRADEGRVATCGQDPVRRRRELSRRVGYLSQRFSLYGDLTVEENVDFFAEVHGVSRWGARRDELLSLLHLAAFRTRLAERLSGGMKQKLALACTLIHTPELLVLDEPTTGVDPVSRREFWKILAGLQREGLTLLLTTPYLDEAERCQRVALIDHGRLLQVDAPQTLREASGQRMVEILAEPRRRAQEWLRGDSAVGEVESFGQRLHVTLTRKATPEETTAEGLRLAAGLRAAGVEVESARAILPSLEDIFIARIRSSEGSAPQEATR